MAWNEPVSAPCGFRLKRTPSAVPCLRSTGRRSLASATCETSPQAFPASTSSAGVSPARTSPPRGKVQALKKESDLDSGSSSLALLPSSDLRLWLLKMSRAESADGCPRCGDTCTCLDTIPMLTVFLPSTWEPLTRERGSSLLPTPSACSYGSNQGGAAGRTGKVRASLQTMAARGLLATPTAHNAKETGAPAEMRRNSRGLGTLAFHGLLATPTETANQLCLSMRKWPGCVARQEIHPRGPLLPSFVEWMMGFPADWTACDLLETPLSPSARKPSGE